MDIGLTCYKRMEIRQPLDHKQFDHNQLDPFTI